MHNIEKTSKIIRSLSGLVNYHDLIIGVSDEYHGLFIRRGSNDEFYNFSNYPADISYENQKKLKPDQESISIFSYGGKDYLITFPSLSKPNRNEIGVFCISFENGIFKILSHKLFKLEKLLNQIQSSTEINIEGHVQLENKLYLLNRGNQKTTSELIVINDGLSLLNQIVSQESDSSFQYSISNSSIDLGQYQGHPIHWTDGILENENTFLFLATVEKTDNAFDDGVVLASFMGRLDVKTGHVTKIKKILDSKKAEGICRWNSRYLVSIDSDSPEMANEFYSFPYDVLD